MKIPSYSDPEARSRAVATASERAIHPEALAALIEQQEALPSSEARDRSLARLQSPDTAVVFSGQQVGLFLGPMFGLYKALTAVSVASSLSRETGKQVVPIFWLQTEDHDFEEIRSVSILNRDSIELTLQVGAEEHSSSSSVQYLRFDDSLTALHLDLRRELSAYPASSEILDILERHYRSGELLADAFARTLAELTNENGLLFFNPRSSLLTTSTAPIFEKAFSEADTISSTLSLRSNELRAQGLEEQVHIREDSPLPFFHFDSEKGPRHRLTRKGDTWNAIGSKAHKIGTEELQVLLKNEPQRFSASALLRPILQDTLFPTAAYVGGEAELRYFQQVEILYPLFSLPAPLVVPRASFRLKETKAQKWLDELSLNTTDLRLPETELIAQVDLRASDGALDPSRLREQTRAKIGEAMETLRENIEKVDSTLLGSLEKTSDKTIRAIDSTLDRYSKAVLRTSETTRSRLTRLQTIFYPRGLPQERVYSPVSFLCRNGRSLVQKLLEAIEPFSEDTVEIEL